MYSGKTVFAQLMDCLPWSTFSRLVARYGGDYDVRTFPCVEQYRAMAFAQLTYRESLRDIEACLSAQPAKLYHPLWPIIDGLLSVHVRVEEQKTGHLCPRMVRLPGRTGHPFQDLAQ